MLGEGEYRLLEPALPFLMLGEEIRLLHILPIIEAGEHNPQEPDTLSAVA